MGYNRSGTRRRQKLKRAKREYDRLEKKRAAAPDGSGHAPEQTGLLAKVKGAAQKVASTVGSAVKSAVDTVRGKHDEPKG